MTNGSQLSQEFGSKEPLSAVRLYVQMNRMDDDGPFNLKTTFPSKIFTEEDMDKPLDNLGKCLGGGGRGVEAWTDGLVLLRYDVKLSSWLSLPFPFKYTKLSVSCITFFLL